MEFGLELKQKLAVLAQTPLFLGQAEEDYLKESRTNMDMIALPAEDALQLSIEELLSFLYEVVELRNRQLLAQFELDQQAVFYCWFDEQAAQLRWSIISAHWEKLPFGCQVQPTADLRRVIEKFLTSPDHNGIPRHQLQGADPLNASSQVMEPNSYTLEVWIRKLLIGR